jgi:hypothetical protein
MERQSSVILELTRATDQGVAATKLKKIPGASGQIKKLKAEGAIQGPMKIGRSNRYFVAEHAPKRDQIARRIEELLRDAGLRLTSLSKLDSLVKFAPKTLFNDALSALKAEGRIVEVRDARRSKLYLHCEPLLEQLRQEPPVQPPSPEPEQPPKPPISLDQVRPVYRMLKAQQGGISAVNISDVLKGIKASKAELHHLLLHESKKGRITLHRATTVNFAPEVFDAGIRIDGEPDPFVTFVLKESA